MSTVYSKVHYCTGSHRGHGTLFARSPGSRPWRILLVDDDPDFLMAARRVLSASPRLRAKIETALDPDEAMRLVEERPLDAVLADYRMDPRPGTDLLRHIAEKEPSLKRVLLTGFDPEMVRDVNPCDVDLVLNKDDLLTDLDRRLGEFLTRPRGP